MSKKPNHHATVSLSTCRTRAKSYKQKALCYLCRKSFCANWRGCQNTLQRKVNPTYPELSLTKTNSQEAMISFQRADWKHQPIFPLKKPCCIYPKPFSPCSSLPIRSQKCSNIRINTTGQIGTDVIQRTAGRLPRWNDTRHRGCCSTTDTTCAF